MRVANVVRREINREYGELAFQPIGGAGEYYVHYLPNSGEGRANEVSVLQQVIKDELEDLHTEIHHTDDHQYLKDKQAALERIKDVLARAAV